jgi:hypothetical protein
VLAVNGLDSPGLLKLLQDAPSERYELVVLSKGANDAMGLCAPLQWALWQNQLVELIVDRYAPALLVHSAVPPCMTAKLCRSPCAGSWAGGRGT